MTNDTEKFTAPGKYEIDKFFEKLEILLYSPKYLECNHSEKLKNKNYQLKKQYNRMQIK